MRKSELETWSSKDEEKSEEWPGASMLTLPVYANISSSVQLFTEYRKDYKSVFYLLMLKWSILFENNKQ